MSRPLERTISIHSIKFVAATVAILSSISALTAQNAKQTKKDEAAVRSFLQKRFPGKKWQTGPKRIDSKEVHEVFGKGRYYFVFSATPLPPGAPLKQLLDAYQRKVKEIRDHHLLASVRINDKGEMTAFQSVKDFQRELQPAKKADRQKLVTAAVLSLYGAGRVSPGPVPAAKVAIRTSTNGDINCTAQPNRFSMGFVTFDKNGNLKSIAKRYTGPLPP